jgi:murein DD-endopeptidase MepM/ murein hydrolase activator NlpD
LYYQPEADDASVAVLKSRLTELGPVSARQRKALADEMKRVRAYEKELQQRAAELDAAISEALESETSESGAGASDIAFEPLEELLTAESITPISATALDNSAEASTARQTTASYRPRLFEVETSDTLRQLDAQLSRLEALPLGAPVVGRISSDYGSRRSPFSRHSDFHAGIDFAGHYRSNVWATGKGVVSKAGYMSGYGLTVIVDHGNGLSTLYGHLSKIKVKRGDSISRGTTLGLLGSTGRSTGPHVHYEIRHQDRPINPIRLVDLVSLRRFV